jgi:hypothetical protein
MFSPVRIPNLRVILDFQSDDDSVSMVAPHDKTIKTSPNIFLIFLNRYDGFVKNERPVCEPPISGLVS